MHISTERRAEDGGVRRSWKATSQTQTCVHFTPATVDQLLAAKVFHDLTIPTKEASQLQQYYEYLMKGSIYHFRQTWPPQKLIKSFYVILGNDPSNATIRKLTSECFKLK